jgi:hypothetical protein
MPTRSLSLLSHHNSRGSLCLFMEFLMVLGQFGRSFVSFIVYLFAWKLPEECRKPRRSRKPKLRSIIKQKKEWRQVCTQKEKKKTIPEEESTILRPRRPRCLFRGGVVGGGEQGRGRQGGGGDGWPGLFGYWLAFNGGALLVPPDLFSGHGPSWKGSRALRGQAFQEGQQVPKFGQTTRHFGGCGRLVGGGGACARIDDGN